MPSYECHAISLDKLAIGPRGVKEPLCNSCVNPECDNPIRQQTVNVFGIVRKWRLWVVNNAVRQVVDCKGYVAEDENDTVAPDSSGTGTGTSGTSEPS